MTGRLSIWRAAMVIARRDFTAILFSRSFIFFLLGPLFPVLVGALAGGIGSQVSQSADQPQLGVAMTAPDLAAIRKAYDALEPRVSALPELVVLKELRSGESYDPRAALSDRRLNLAAVLSGSPDHPHLTGSKDTIERWDGPVALLAATAQGRAPAVFPDVTLAPIAAATSADQTHGRLMTAQLGQTVLFLLTMLLAGMVLSNLVEEKGNKIIEILAAAIPMDAVFLGKLFAMLAVSWVGIAVWAGVGSAVWFGAGNSLSQFPAPAVGWPLFLLLGTAYFSMAYLLLGSLFLAIGSMAATVREVQTLSMPVTMLQLLNFFFATYAVARQGTLVELAAIAVPFSSPFAMLARAALNGAVWPHLAALAWQALWVAISVRLGATLFRKRVMKSGSGRGAVKPGRQAA